jgi:transposase
MRQIEFLDQEIKAVEQLIAQAALGSVEIKRLMSVPGVNVIVASTFLAAVGDIQRFKNPRKLVGYLGLDPRVRQSGPGPATHGHISKQGSTRARHALVEACWTTVRQPGPLHAFYQRIRSRRGHSVAIVAAARKLACLFWCLLTREQDYAFAQPSLTDRQEAAAARGHRGRTDPTGQAQRRVGHPRADAPSRACARSTGRACLPAHGPRLAGCPGGEGGRERDTGARIK